MIPALGVQAKTVVFQNTEQTKNQVNVPVLPSCRFLHQEEQQCQDGKLDFSALQCLVC